MRRPGCRSTSCWPDSGLEDEFLDRAVVTDIGGTGVPVIDVADLLIAKLLAGRPKDIEDARALWRVHGRELDDARVRRTLRLLEAALSQSDLVSTFETLTRPRSASSVGTSSRLVVGRAIRSQQLCW